MPSTLNVDVAVNQSQLQTAVSSIQKTISSASYGGGGFGGFTGGGLGGFSFPASFSGGAMPGRSNFIIPPHPHQYAVQSSSLPVGMMRQQLNALMQSTMGQAASGGGMSAGLQYMMPKFAPVSQGKIVAASAAKAAATATTFNLGGAVGAGIGTAMFGPIGGFAGSWLGGMVTEKIFGGAMNNMVEDIFYGSSKSRNFSSRTMNQVLGNMRDARVGGFMATTMGFRPVDFATPRARAGFTRQLGSISLGMARSLRMDPGDFATTFQAMAFRTGGLEMMNNLNRTLSSMKSASTGQINFDAFKQSDAYKNFKAGIVDLRNTAARENLLPAEIVSAEANVESFFRYRRPRVSAWTRMGHSIGRSMGMGKRWGKDLMYALKPLVSRDLNMTRDELRVVGGSKKRGAMYSQFALSGFAPGGESWYRTMLMGAGQTPGDLFDIGGQMATAFSDPQSGMQAVINVGTNMRRMGGAGIIALQRKTAMDSVKFLRETGVIDNRMSNADAYQFMLQSRGMPEIKARAMARATMGIGKEVLYAAASGYMPITEKYGFSKALQRRLGMKEGDKKFVSRRFGRSIRNLDSITASAAKRARAALAKRGDTTDDASVAAYIAAEGRDLVPAGLNRVVALQVAGDSKGADAALRAAMGADMRSAMGSSTGKSLSALERHFKDSGWDLAGGITKFSEAINTGNYDRVIYSITGKDAAKKRAALRSLLNDRTGIGAVARKISKSGAGKRYLKAQSGADVLTGDQWTVLLGKSKALFDALETIVQDMKQGKR
jgi:hypothetical protein